MNTTTHGQYLLRLTFMHFVNCYLVREEEGFTLIDTGMRRSAPGILAAAHAAGTPIRRIVLTHAHVDHVGGLDALHAVLPEAEVFVSAREARFMAGDRTLDEDERHGKLRGGLPTCTTRPTVTLTGGEHIGSLEVIPSSGHTPGHIALLDTRDRTLIAGDAFTTYGGVTVTGQLTWRFPFPAFATWDKLRALESARVLRACEPARLAVGHGPVVEDPLDAIDAAIRTAEKAFSR